MEEGSGLHVGSRGECSNPRTIGCKVLKRASSLRAWKKVFVSNSFGGLELNFGFSDY